MQRHESWDLVSDTDGNLSDQAVEELLHESPDRAAEILIEASAATNPDLRNAARALSRSILLRSSRPHPGGHGRLKLVAKAGIEGEIDLEASLDEIVRARRGHQPIDPTQLVARGWRHDAPPICAVIDASASMKQAELFRAAALAVAIVTRSPQSAVLVFASRPIWARRFGATEGADVLIDRLITLAPRGATNLASALRRAQEGLSSFSNRGQIVLASDCNTNEGPEVSAGRSSFAMTIVHSTMSAAVSEVAATLNARVLVADSLASLAAAADELTY